MKLYHLYFRKIYGKVFVVLLASWLPLQVVAQEQKSVLQMAEEAYARQEYAPAAALYERLVQQRGKRVKTAQLMKLAACYREVGLFDNAGNWYARITTLPDCPPEAWFALGEVLRNRELYAEAKQQYARFTSPKADSMQLKALALRACDSALVWKQQRADVTLNPVKELNTENSEIISGVVKDGLLLISNGYRSMQMNDKMEKHPAADKRTLQPYYKPYIFKQYSVGDSNVLLEELFPQLLGGYRYHIGPLCMNKGEDTLYVTINEQDKVLPDSLRGPVSGIRRLNIYQSVKQNGKWTTPVLLANINKAGYSSGYPVLAEQGGILYFVSDRPEGQGQSDIWYSEKQADGSWGEPVNCGPVLNTVAAEAFPTINEDGALYFSSKGHPGMGGYDVFRAIGSRAQWQEPDNMKAPFNTGGDDIGLILKRNAYEGFISSNRQGGTGADDIYAFKDAYFFSRLRPAGGSSDGDDRNGSNRNNGNNDHGGNGNNGGGNSTNGHTGTAKTNVPRKLTPEEEKDKAELEKLQFFYKFNSTELLTESRRILDYVAGIMQRHPDWKLVVVSYTDSRGTDTYNRDLSTMRCYAVINYLDDKGISPKRVYYRNMTRDGIANGCLDGVPCNESQHQQNRRSELKVIY
ncbi:OmpA family protein [Chitinophaga qingshengii]|uniref:OmpA family protein n=1 Tax=Chitinophaga qingshengii TaxID=1569794 RepID=A0ABR7TFI5_9BACT|nr:OmpA family protein [Chitinophaga qingshengii]MBC9929108.1 OmpA family protein [Chitinophaga qingshengii]